MKHLSHFLIVGVAMMSLSVSAGCAGGTDVDEQIKFPYLLRISSNHVLVVHGQQMPDSVTLTWEPGDSLRVDGIPVYPGPAVPPRVFSEEELERIYKGIPFVVKLVSAGASWTDAAKQYVQRRKEVRGAAVRVYWATIDSTGSPALASQAVLKSLDRSLLLPGSEPNISGRILEVEWNSDPVLPKEWIDLSPRPTEPVARKPKIFTERQAQGRAQSMILDLEPEDPIPGLLIISAAATVFWHGPEAAEGIRQVEFAKRGLVSKGPVDESDLKEIMQAYGGK